MAAPVRVSDNSGTNNGTSLTINLPASIVAGNLLVVLVSSGGNPGAITATGWSSLAAEGTPGFLQLFYKTATGSEGATASWTSASTMKGGHVSIQYSGWSGTPEKATAVTGSGVNADPPNLAPSTGASDYTFIAAMADGGNGLATGAPTNYSNLKTAGVAASGAVSSADRALTTVSSENPGAFTSGSVSWLAQTFSIKGSGSASFTLAVAAGSYTLTGVAIGVRKGYVLAMAKGAYTLTGLAAGVIKGYVLAMAKGTYTLTGVAAGTRVARRLGAITGSYILTGVAAGVRKGYVIAMAKGTYTLTGLAAGVIKGYVLAMAKGTYTLTGVAAGVRKGYTIALATGSYVLTGIAAGTRVARRLSAVRGIYTLTGSAANIRKGYVLALAKGTYTLTGIAAGIVKGYVLAAITGSYVLTGIPLILARFVGTIPLLRRAPAILYQTRVSQAALERIRVTAAVLYQTRVAQAALEAVRSSKAILYQTRQTPPTLED